MTPKALKRLIEAIVMSHPDPAKLRGRWDRLSSPRRADSLLDAATKNRTADHASTFHFANWTEKLDRHHPKPS